MEKSLIKKHWYSIIFSTHRTIASVTNVCIIPFARSHFCCAFHLHQLLLKVNFISFSMQSRTQQKNFETKQNKTKTTTSISVKKFIVYKIQTLFTFFVQLIFFKVDFNFIETVFQYGVCLLRCWGVC